METKILINNALLHAMAAGYVALMGQAEDLRAVSIVNIKPGIKDCVDRVQRACDAARTDITKALAMFVADQNLVPENMRVTRWELSSEDFELYVFAV